VIAATTASFAALRAFGGVPGARIAGAGSRYGGAAFARAGGG